MRQLKISGCLAANCENAIFVPWVFPICKALKKSVCQYLATKYVCEKQSAVFSRSLRHTASGYRFKIAMYFGCGSAVHDAISRWLQYFFLKKPHGLELNNNLKACCTFQCYYYRNPPTVAYAISTQITLPYFKDPTTRGIPKYYHDIFQ